MNKSLFLVLVLLTKIEMQPFSINLRCNCKQMATFTTSAECNQFCEILALRYLTCFLSVAGKIIRFVAEI